MTANSKIIVFTEQYLESLPLGRVLKREGTDKRLRLVRPISIKYCEVCNRENLKKAAKWEGKNNYPLLTMCLKCTAEELENGFEKEGVRI